jgi:hypothetical protein
MTARQFYRLLRCCSSNRKWQASGEIFTTTKGVLSRKLTPLTLAYFNLTRKYLPPWADYKAGKELGLRLDVVQRIHDASQNCYSHYARVRKKLLEAIKKP